MWSVALSFDAAVLVAGSWNGEVRVWRRQQQQQQQRRENEDDRGTLDEEEEEGDEFDPTMEYVELKPPKPKSSAEASAGNKKDTDEAKDAEAEADMKHAKAALIVRSDRVFSVSLARGGRVLAVGDRAGYAAVYRLPPPPSRLQYASPFTLTAPTIPQRKTATTATSAATATAAATAAAASVVVLELEVKYPNRIFSVALCSDASLLALGGVHKQVWLYSTLTKRRLHVFKLPSVVWSVAFTTMPGAAPGGGGGSEGGFALAMGGEDRVVSVWQCGKGGGDSSDSDDDDDDVDDDSCDKQEAAGAGNNGAEVDEVAQFFSQGRSSTPPPYQVPSAFKRLLRLTRPRDVNCLSFSRDALCLASGTKVVVLGGLGGKQWSWRDRPDFECMAELLNEGDQSGMHTVLSRFPSAANLCHPHSGESMMQHAVRLHTNDVLATVRYIFLHTLLSLVLCSTLC